jgi:hypothetical protein
MDSIANAILAQTFFLVVIFIIICIAGERCACYHDEYSFPLATVTC